MDVNQPSPPHHTAGNRQHKDLDPKAWRRAWTCMILAPPTPTSHPSPGGHTQPCSKVTAQKPGSQTRNPPTFSPPQLLESDITKTLITDCGYKDMRVEKEDGGGTYPWSISTTIRLWRSVDFLSKPKYHVLRTKASTSLVERKPQNMEWPAMSPCVAGSTWRSIT